MQKMGPGKRWGGLGRLKKESLQKCANWKYPLTYKRNGANTLVAGLMYLMGKSLTSAGSAITTASGCAFCARLTARRPKDKTLQLICDNYATHKHPNVQECLEKH